MFASDGASASDGPTHGKYFAITQSMHVCIHACRTYCFDTYIYIPRASRIIYFGCSISFSLEYLLKLFAAKNYVRFLFLRLSSHVDVISIVFGFINFVYVDRVEV